jgi:peptide-methionine (S)-S-oxide reductase
MYKTNLETAYFGGGCFWCTEAVFDRVKGVHSVVPGYSGGKSQHPSYYQVSEGDTGHAEIIRIEFDPSIITYDQLLDIFFHTHNPTTLNQQGADTGTQYRSIILFASEAQQDAAEKMKFQLNKNNEFGKPIVTEIKPLESFYEAEDYHHDYYKKNENAPYCQFVISPKVAAFQKRYHELLKPE